MPEETAGSVDCLVDSHVLVGGGMMGDPAEDK